MSRGWITLGVVLLLVAKAWGQEGRSTDDVAGTASKSPMSVPAPSSSEPVTGLAYTIEIKLVEGKVDSRNDFDKPTPRSDVQLEPIRRPSKNDRDSIAVPPLTGTRLEADLNGSDDEVKIRANDLQSTQSRGESDDIWVTVSQDPHLKTILAPRMLVPAKRSATVEVRNPQTFSYLEPLGNDNFRLRRTEKEKLGMRFTVKVQPVEGEADCVDSSFDFETTTLDGREPVKGLDLDVGKPIIASRNLRSTARVDLGTTRLIPIPSDPSTEAALLLRIKRYEPEKKK